MADDKITEQEADEFDRAMAQARQARMAQLISGHEAEAAEVLLMFAELAAAVGYGFYDELRDALTEAFGEFSAEADAAVDALEAAPPLRRA